MTENKKFIKIRDKIINMDKINYIIPSPHSDDYYVLCVESGKSITISEWDFNKIVEKLELTEYEIQK